jgi:hypothetical protein
MRVDKVPDLRTISSRNIVLVRVWDIGNESGADLRLSRGAAAIFAWGLQAAFRRAQRAYASQLLKPISASELNAKDPRVVRQIEAVFRKRKIATRFNHYKPGLGGNLGENPASGSSASVYKPAGQWGSADARAGCPGGHPA